MGPKLRARLANIKAMSKPDLLALRADLIAAFNLADDNGASVADLTEIVDAKDSVDAEVAERDEADALRDRINDTSDEGDGAEGDGEGDEGADDGAEEAPADAPDGPEAVPSFADPVEPDEVQGTEGDGDTQHQDAVAAAANRPALGDVQRRAGKPAVPAKPALRVKTRLVAAGDVVGFSAGQEISTSAALAAAMSRKLQSIGKSGPSGDVLVASLFKEYPEERTLTDDAFHNDAIIEAALGAESLVASGGLCQPVSVDYAINTIGSTARPFRDSLPSFAAVRGGLRFTPQPLLSSVTPPTPYTVAMDVAVTPKTCFTVACGNPVEADVYGIPVCLKVGNFGGRFSPETVAANQQLLDVAAARVGELTLINAVDAGSTAVTSTGILGTIRTVLPTVDLINAGYRYRNRLDESSALRTVLPLWVKDEVRADLAMELAHDRDGSDNNLMVTDAMIDAYFAARGVSIVWTLEDKANSFGAAQAAGALNPWPATFVAYVYAEGTWQFLDGGRIDLGVTRDSTLNTTNDYEIWREDFEGIAKRGAESLKVTVTAKPTGMSAGTMDTH
jgi:hypothetical protein